jgi:hypothetical protein
MRRASLLCAAALLAALLAQTTARAQADVSLPAAYLGKPYSQNLIRVLRETYKISVPSASPNRALEWRALGLWPRGLSVDPATGTVFGTPDGGRPPKHRFLVQVADPATRPSASARYWLVLAVLNGEGGGANQPKEVPAPAQPERGEEMHVDAPPVPQRGGSDDIEIPTIVPRKELVLPITIKNDAIRQLEVLVFNKDEKLIDTKTTPDNLARGEVRTSVTVKLEEGRNTVQVRNADTKDVYKSLVVTLRPTDVDKPQKPALEIRHSGFAPGSVDTTPVTVFVGDPKVQAINVSVKAKDAAGAYTVEAYKEKTIKLERGKDEYVVIVNLKGGENLLTVSDVTPGSNLAPKTLMIKRDDALNPDKPPVQVGYSPFASRNSEAAQLTITVNDPKIAKLKVKVTGKNADDPVYTNVIQLERGVDTVYEVVKLSADPESTVGITDVTKVEDPKKDDGVKVYEPFKITRREGQEQVAQINVNSLNTRAIIGFEQAGASAAGSEGKPFLDFFFTAPIRYKPYKDELPRASVWANLRFAAIPQQVSAFGTFASNFVNPLAEGQIKNQLVQGFDFTVGPEFRLFGTNKNFPSVIPGIKQRTHVYFAGGFGAISPLSTERGAAQIFQVPAEGSPQRENFLNLFPGAKDKKYIAFVFPDRDRFLRQYYAGIRLKTHFYDEEGLINRFPAIFDVMFGQNEAATGGKLRNVVMRLEGFYPFPLRAANFLYLYGTAMMKFGGGGVKISTPLFLDTADSTISITNNDVFIAPTLQSNKDYYRVGIGINLTELFNRKPSTQAK